PPDRALGRWLVDEPDPPTAGVLIREHEGTGMHGDAPRDSAMMVGRESQAERVYFRKPSRSSAGIPDSTKTSLHQKLSQRKRERWPQLKEVTLRFRGRFAYVDGVLPNGDVLPLCRLRYGGYASEWGFAFYAASSESYEDSVLPSGAFVRTPQEALDCACGTYLGDPSAWVTD